MNLIKRSFGFCFNLKDTVFNHYLEIQGNVDTKENILVQPEFSGTLLH
jgi:hypothetical protein